MHQLCEDLCAGSSYFGTQFGKEVSSPVYKSGLLSIVCDTICGLFVGLGCRRGHASPWFTPYAGSNGGSTGDQRGTIEKWSCDRPHQVSHLLDWIRSTWYHFEQTGRQAGANEAASPCSFVGPRVLIKSMLPCIVCTLVPCSAGVAALLLTTTNTV